MTKIKRIILFFDEAQTLLKKDAMQFRWIRRWLRIKSPGRKKIVAVFSGTSSSLSNYYPDVTESHDSRNSGIETITTMTSKIPTLMILAFYDPFYELTTVGSLASNIKVTRNA